MPAIKYLVEASFPRAHLTGTGIAVTLPFLGIFAFQLFQRAEQALMYEGIAQVHPRLDSNSFVQVSQSSQNLKTVSFESVIT